MSNTTHRRRNARPTHLLAICVGLLLLCATPAVAGPTAAFEKPPVLQLSDAAPEALRAGSGFSVDALVPTDGLTTNFTLRGGAHVFAVLGVQTLALRVSELPAIAELEKSSKMETFTKALAATAAKPFQSAAKMVRNPVDTAKGIPAGLGRFFDRVGSGAKRLSDTVTNSAASGSDRASEAAAITGSTAKDAFGYEKELRMLAKQLGVDPYTTNPVLAAKLHEFANVAFAGHVGLNTLISVVIPVSLVITGTNVTSDLVYDTPRGDLVVRNEKALRSMGVTDDELRVLQDAPGFTLSVQTALVDGLAKLDGVAGRPEVVALAATATTADQAYFLTRGVHMLARHHTTAAPLARVSARGTIVGHEKGGGIVVPAAVDFVSWTEQVSRFAQREDLAGALRGVWLTGRMTPLARQQFEALGWRVHEGVRE